MSEPALIPAATILLLRDAPGLEVLMVERHHQIDFASGALVFPGGKINARDLDDEWRDFCDGAEQLSPEARGLRIGALREAFEESGMLLARLHEMRGDGAPFCEGAAIETMGAVRAAIDRGEESFLAHCRARGLVLALDALAAFAHWITPKGMPKRFDTMFYAAIAPESQRAICDGREAVDACWISPHEALEAGRSGRRKIIFPTRLNLERLATFESASSVIAACAQTTPVTIEPHIVAEDGVMVLRIPENAGYATTRELLDNAV